jgi:hypothetical protein
MTVREWLDIGWFVVSVIGIVIARYWPSLDAEARKWLSIVGGADAVKRFITEAAEMCGNGESNSVKRQFVLNEMRAAAKTQGLELPDSVGNIILEFVFRQAKPTLPKCPEAK